MLGGVGHVAYDKEIYFPGACSAAAGGGGSSDKATARNLMTTTAPAKNIMSLPMLLSCVHRERQETNQHQVIPYGHA